MKLELRKFDISKISHDSVVVMIGKRRTGKSFLVKDMLYYHTDIPLGTVISGTEIANRFYGEFVPNVFIHDEVDPELMTNVVKRQYMIKKQIGNEERLYGGSKIDPRTFVILDDCLYDGSWARDKNIRSLFMNGRHFPALFIITMQYPLGIPPNLRTNIDYVFILRENIVANRKRIFENYAGMFPSFEVFCQVMDQCTENFECLVINNSSLSNKLEDCVFYYRGEQHENYRMCSNRFWMNNDQVEDENSDDEFSKEPFQKNKSGVKINVLKR
jgi:hypothetical protein